MGHRRRGPLGVGAPLHACTRGRERPERLPQPSNRTGQQGPRPGHQPRDATRSSRKTVFSRRFGYVEPYSGFCVQADFPHGGQRLRQVRTRRRTSTRTPPLQGSFALGLEVIPYEHARAVPAPHRPTSASRARTTRRGATTRSSSTRSARRRRRPCAPRTRPRTPDRRPNGTERRRPERARTSSSPASPSSRRTAASAVRLGHVAGRRVHQVHAGHGAHLRPVAPHHGRRRVQPELATTEPRGGRTVRQREQRSSQGVPNPDHRDIIDLPGHRFSSTTRRSSTSMRWASSCSEATRAEP